jgi:catechol 2,3-dioxygenase-like lactoylglutathione lyase family enzyme
MDEQTRTLQDIWKRSYQVAVVVRDIDAATEFYERLGIGPFEEGPSAHTLERRIYGEDALDAEVRGRTAMMGAIELELLEPVAGRTVQGDFLEKHGEGVIHICAHTDDLDRDIAVMEELGIGVISYGVISDGGKFAYFDTRAVGGLILELAQPGLRW